MYKIVNEAGRTEILLYSLIYDGQTARNLISQLPSEGEITLRINSDGGDVFEAIAIYNYLKGRRVSVVIDGLCASAASIVAMSGCPVSMRTGSMMMLHQPLSAVYGNAEVLREAAAVLDKVSEGVAAIYQEQTNLPIEKVKALMESETWLTAEECLAYGLCDAVDPGEIPNLENERKTYADGVREERERLRALDELSAPGREGILTRAKYETLQSVQDVAIELLKSERYRPTVSAVNPVNQDEAAISLMIEQINQKRGK